MKARISKVGGILEKTGLAELKIDWPEKLSEFRNLLGKQKMGEAEIELTEEKICGYAWRGFTLAFQSGEGEVLSEAEKAERKELRKADNAVFSKIRSKAKDAGMTVSAYLDAHPELKALLS